MTTIIDKRNFCLMLSSHTGQNVAHQLGFAPPSKDVLEKEQELIEGQWETLHHFGIFAEIVESVEWFSQVLEHTAPTGQTPEMIESAKTVVLSYSMALIQKLLSNNKIALLAPMEPLFFYNTGDGDTNEPQYDDDSDDYDNN